MTSTTQQQHIMKLPLKLQNNNQNQQTQIMTLKLSITILEKEISAIIDSKNTQ